MTRKPKYPDEAPVVEYEGEIWIAYPRLIVGFYQGSRWVVPQLVLEQGDGWECWPSIFPEYVRPLTPAARALVRWARGRH